MCCVNDVRTKEEKKIEAEFHGYSKQGILHVKEPLNESYFPFNDVRCRSQGIHHITKGKEL